MEGEHQACFAGTKMEPALIGSGLALGFAMAKPRLCAAPRSGRHGNQWEEEGEDERFNNISINQGDGRRKQPKVWFVGTISYRDA